MFMGILCLLLLAFPAYARPYPHPPSDFRGDIYVDDRGCVFNRDGRKWVARKVDGEQICGFPPSLSSLRIEKPEETPHTSLFEVEQDLNAILGSGIRQGELVADTREREPIADAPPASGQNEFTGHLAALVKRDAELQAALSGSFRETQICERLGYQVDLNPRPVLGWDVTMGLCPGLRAYSPEKNVRLGKRLDRDSEQPAVTVDAALAPRKPKDNKTASAIATGTSDGDAKLRTPKSRPAPKPAKPRVASTVTSGTSHQKPQGHIKTVQDNVAEKSTKYIEVGFYHDDRTAKQVIRNVIRMGYKAAQAYRRQDRQTIRIIYAGPFEEPSGMNEALSKLRRQGYPDAAIR